MPEYVVRLPEPTPKQALFIDSPAKRMIIKAGRRGGKTVGVGIKATNRFIDHRRVLYAAPTAEQISRFWHTVTTALAEPIAKGVLYKNESEHIIEISEKVLGDLINNKEYDPQEINRLRESRIRAKTAWNADTLRGDYADELILDEWQLMDEDAWLLVGAPMLLDNDGNVTFIYTPPSLQSRSVSKAKDPQHASKLFKRYQELAKIKPQRFQTFHFTSMDNPYLSMQALEEIASDMTSIGYRMEILAEDVMEAPGALWKREGIDLNRLTIAPTLDRVVVAIDPSATSAGDEAGVIGAGKAGAEGYLLADRSIQGSPLKWATAAIALYYELKADRIIAEANNGGEMISTVINQVDANVPVKLVHASRGKQTRAEPISAKYEKDKVHHVGKFEKLEDEMCLWVPGDPSPNRMDAMVWAFTELLLGVGSANIRILGQDDAGEILKQHQCFLCGENKECIEEEDKFYCLPCLTEKRAWDKMDPDD